MIDKLTIDRIFSAADIAEVVSEFVTLKRKGVNYTACCPFHSEKTPSFIVSPAKGLYKCFGCGKGGNAVSFVMEHEKLSYPEALRWVARKYNIEIAESAQSDEQRQANNDRESMMVLNSWTAEYFAEQMQTPRGVAVGRSYLVERGFTEQTIRKFELGYCPEGGDVMSRAAIKSGYQEEFLVKTGLTILPERGGYYDRFSGRVMFPIHSLSGRVIGFGGRTLRNDKKSAKYLNSPESEVYHKSQTLYGIYFAKKAITQQDRCILVEGYTDVIQMHQSGIENVVASSGTSLTQEQIKLIRRFSNNITVIYDGDSAGIKASMRGIDMILAQGLTVRCVLLPEGEDPDSFARKHNATELSEFIARNEVDFITFKTKLLLADTQNDPIKRAELINDIISTISVIPQAVERQVFVRECSRMMDVDESLLQREVERKRLTSINGSDWYESVRRRDDVRAITPETLPTVEIQTTSPVLAELAVLEHELLGYLLKYGDEVFELDLSPTESVSLGVAQTIVQELQENEIRMQTPLFQTIYSEYADLLTQKGQAPHHSYFINHSNQEVAAFATDVFFQEEAYRTSRIWQQNEIVITSERDRLCEAIPKALSIYLHKTLNQQIYELNASLGGVDDELRMMSILEQITHKNELRRQICDKYQRTV